MLTKGHLFDQKIAVKAVILKQGMIAIVNIHLSLHAMIDCWWDSNLKKPNESNDSFQRPFCFHLILSDCWDVDLKD